DLGDDEVWRVEWEWRGPEKLAIRAIQRPDASALADVHRNVANFTATDCGIDPLHKPRIGIHGRANERSLFVDVFIPIVTGKMLIKPLQLSGVRIERNS